MEPYQEQLFNKGTGKNEKLVDTIPVLLKSLALMAILSYIILKTLNIMTDNTFFQMLDYWLLIFTSFMLFMTSLVCAVRSKGLPQNKSMLLFLASSMTFFIAEIAWTWNVLFQGIEMPYPSIADIFYLLATIFLAIAIFYLSIYKEKKFKIETEIVATGIGILGLMIIAYVFNTEIFIDSTPAILFLDIAYPLLDTICLVLIANLLIGSIGTRAFKPFLIIFVSIIILFFSDVIFSILIDRSGYSTGSIVDVLFAIFYVLLAIGIKMVCDDKGDIKNIDRNKLMA